jgi:Tfp pilus assembly protein PilF
MYPKDKRVAYLAGFWLFWRGSYEPAKRMLEHALALDGNYPPALNELGYLHATLGDFRNATAFMRRYVAVLPNEPNPHDSYAEILRMSGDFEAALRHYRIALQIDTKFSHLGIADTFALMGNEPQARTEYEQAIRDAENEAERVAYSLQSAMTYVREHDYVAADRAFQAVAQRAHSGGLVLHEAQAYRMMATYQPNDSVALKYLARAQAVVAASKDLAQSEREDERARILRVRVVRAANAADQKLAVNSLNRLRSMAATSRSPVVRRSYHAAAGALLSKSAKYAQAIPHLQEDSKDAFSLELLSRAHAKVGARQEAQEEERKLASMNEPTLDQALVVTQVRTKLAARELQNRTDVPNSDFSHPDF